MSKEAVYSPDKPSSGFPIADYERLWQRLAETSPTPRHPLWGELSGAVLALRQRFCALAEHDEDFTDAVREHGDAPGEPYRYIQQRELFEFFENGHAVLETLNYVAYGLGAIAASDDFPMETEDQRKRITLKFTRERFSASFPRDELTRRLDALADDPVYKEWSAIRNVLVHRLVPARKVWLSMTLADGRSTPVYPSEWYGLPENVKVVIDHTTTASRREWLASVFATFVQAANGFVITRFG